MTRFPALSRRTVLRTFALSAGAAAAAPLLALDIAFAEPADSSSDEALGTITALTRINGVALGANRRHDGTYELVHLGRARLAPEPMDELPSSSEVTGLCVGADGVLYACGSTTTSVLLAHVQSDAGGMSELRGSRYSSALWRRGGTGSWEQVYEGPRECLYDIASSGGSVMAVGALLDEEGVHSGHMSVRDSGRAWRRQKLELATATSGEAALVAVTAWRGMWVAAVTARTGSQLWTSFDGARWQPKPTSSSAARISIRALDGSSAELLIAGNDVATAQPALIAVGADGRARAVTAPGARASAAPEVVLAMTGGDGRRSIAYAADLGASRIAHF